MYLTYPALSALLTLSNAQPLLSVMSANPSLTEFTAVLKKYPIIIEQIGTAGGVTFFAPQNGARGLKELTQLVNGPDAPKQQDSIQRLLSYHTVRGMNSAASIKEGVTFAETYAEGFARNSSGDSGEMKVQLIKEGKKVFLITGLSEKSDVTETDIKFDGGIIHLIDGVLRVPQSPITTANAAGLDFFTKIIAAYNLTYTLESAKNVTLFAPTNVAFTAATTIISGSSSIELVRLLTYHVARGTGYSTDLKDRESLPTVQGGNLIVKITNGQISVNDAKVVRSDLLTNNGVIHVVDKVLVP
ncbi:Fasciclin-domain-containing protein [Tothia fuscella]|uniref:Fasciclin-domain-containing protein n=1 Tax=Tothia fuscella TaxID=1048955 RepID=A0A9P4NFH4_9PEZI|nr:Fasciclin-domain-containing protein [Tothia fuscella]